MMAGTEARAYTHDEMMQRVHQIMVRYPRFMRLLEMMNECLQESKHAAEPQCMSIEGDTGAGKSTLAETMEKAHCRVEEEDRTHIPVLYLLTPSPATIGAMLDALLEALGDPGAGRGTLAAKEKRVKILFKQCRVELVIFDDFQHLVDTETDYVLHRVSEWLKALIKRTKTPFIVMGMPGQVTKVIEANPQLSRLFAAREELTGFAWNENEPDTVKDFARFVAFVEKMAEVRLCHAMERLEVLRRIHYATDGTVGNVMNLIRRAILLADANSVKDVGLEHFDLAFSRRLEKHMKSKLNPFTLPGGSLFVPPETPVASKDPAEAVGKRGKKRTIKQPGVGEVLST